MKVDSIGDFKARTAATVAPGGRTSETIPCDPPEHRDTDPAPERGEFEIALDEHLLVMKNMLMKKNSMYGNSYKLPVCIFSKADLVAGLRIRIDDKLARIARGAEDEQEDTLSDLEGYIILLQLEGGLNG